MFKYIIFIYSSYVVSVQCYKIVWDNSVDFDFNNFDDSNRLGEVRMPNWFFIYPGKLLLYNTLLQQINSPHIFSENGTLGVLIS